MKDAERFRLIGTYRTPRSRIGQRVRCQVRGEVIITGITEAPIRWPIAKGGRGRHSLVVSKGLASAIRREAEQAICHWWRVRTTTVWKWRKALGVGIATEGTSRLHREYTKEPWGVEAMAKAHDPERCRKIAESRKGKSRPPHVLDAMHEAWRGSHHSEESRRKMSQTHRRHGTLVPGTKVWTPEEDEWVKVHLMTGTQTNIVTAVEILDKFANDCPQFKPLVEKTAQGFTIGEVTAEKGYLSVDNLELVAGMGATAYIPYKVNSTEGEGAALGRRYSCGSCSSGKTF